jgi:broad specificity phosphatase PhoE
MRLRPAALLLLLAVPSIQAQESPTRPGPSVVFVVRHAERGTDDPRDPTLSEAGRRRAIELARVMTDVGITALFATEYKRTQETLAPLATALGQKTTIIGGGATDSLVGAIETLPAGSRVIVASHSNLVHLIVKRLSGVEVKPLTDVDYDRLYLITLTGKGTGSVAVLRFGERRD